MPENRENLLSGKLKRSFSNEKDMASLQCSKKRSQQRTYSVADRASHRLSNECAIHWKFECAGTYD
jgi:hypothetical protein